MSESKYRQVSLREIATDIKDGSHGTHPRVTEGIPLLSAKNISENGRLVLGDQEDQIDEFEYGIINSAFAPKKDDLLVTIVGSIGRRALFTGTRVAFQRSVAFVRPSKAILPQYLFHAAGDSAFARQLHRRSNVTAQAGLYLGELAKVSVSLPDEPTQRRIAEILTTVDEAMEQTEALVGKLEQIKAGLMHDLFTRGVWTQKELDRGDAKGLPSEALAKEGHLRPTRQQAPHLYHQTPLGWLPKEWEVGRMNDLLSGIDAGWSPDCIETPPPLGEWGVLKVSAATRGVFDANESKTLPPKLLPLPELEVKSGDVITARANGVAELVGITVQVPDGCPPRLMLSDKLLRLNPNGRALHSFIAGVMSSAKTRQQLEGVMSGSSGQRNISQTQIRNLYVPQPPITEQNQFERLMKFLRARLDTETTHLAKLRQQKQGLMQDLLTGRVPVV